MERSNKQVEKPVLAAEIPVPTEEELRSLWETEGEKKSTKRLRKLVLRELLALPIDESRVFLQAYHQAPAVLKEESDPMLFLNAQFHPGDETKPAAIQMAKYWNARQETFQERAFLPMNTDILNQDEIDLLESGLDVLLPPDDLDRSIIYMDRRNPNNVSQACRPQTLFFLFSMACRLSKRIIMVRYEEGPMRMTPWRTKFGTQYLPIIFDAFIFLHVASDRGMKRHITEQVIPVLPQILQPFFAERLTVYVESSNEEILQHMLQWGCSKEGLPRTAGGTWENENFFRWLKEAQRTKGVPPISLLLRDSKPPALEARESLDESDYAELHQIQGLASLASVAAETFDRDERRRKRQNEYSRRRRDQFRELEISLPIYFDMLTKQRERLVAEHQHLDKLLKAANLCLASFVLHGEQLATAVASVLLSTTAPKKALPYSVATCQAPIPAAPVVGSTKPPPVIGTSLPPLSQVAPYTSIMQQAKSRRRRRKADRRSP